MSFSCASIGAGTCKGHFEAAIRKVIMRQVADHLYRVHNIKTPTQTIMTYVAEHVAGADLRCKRTNQ